MALTSTYMPATNTSLPEEGFMIKAKDFSFSKSDASSSTSTYDENCAIERMTTGYTINGARVDSAKMEDATWKIDVDKISVDTISWTASASDCALNINMDYNVTSNLVAVFTADSAACSACNGA